MDYIDLGKRLQIVVNREMMYNDWYEIEALFLLVENILEKSFENGQNLGSNFIR